MRLCAYCDGAVAHADTSYVVSSLEAGTTYFFKIAALDSNGQENSYSEYSFQTSTVDAQQAPPGCTRRGLTRLPPPQTLGN